MVNITNIQTLITHLNQKECAWKYNNCSLCFMGHVAQLTGENLVVRNLFDNNKEVKEADYQHDADIVANFLGITSEEAYVLCWKLDNPNSRYFSFGGPNREEAIALLERLAVIGDLRKALASG